jgi:hypothetical protein
MTTSKSFSLTNEMLMLKYKLVDVSIKKKNVRRRGI